MDMLDALIDIERAGIKISNEKLAKIKEDYQTEYDQLYSDLMDIAEIAMGDTPINLDSPDDRSKLLYSREVVDKTAWKEAFNIGTEQRGHTKKQKRKTKTSPTMFKETVKDLAPVFRKTRGQRCEDCGGTGRKRNRLKSG